MKPATSAGLMFVEVPEGWWRLKVIKMSCRLRIVRSAKKRWTPTMKVWKVIFLFNRVIFRYHISCLLCLNVFNGSRKQVVLASLDMYITPWSGDNRDINSMQLYYIFLCAVELYLYNLQVYNIYLWQWYSSKCGDQYGDTGSDGDSTILYQDKGKGGGAMPFATPLRESAPFVVPFHAGYLLHVVTSRAFQWRK